ncbi:Pentatricopeptide repeat-containing protein [Nymphaea thermarum]|nr:Pentatricopeptide repeat-containing protein [Nymphaea thermarum]
MSRMCYVLSTVERCKGVWELKQAHSLPVTWGLCGNRLAISSPLDFSSRPTLGGSICWARPIVSQIDNPYPMVYQFNSKIKSLVSMHAYEDALKVYGSMLREGLHPDNYTFPCILKAIVGLQDQESGTEPDEAVLVSVLVACAHLGALDLGWWIHGYVGRKGMKLSIRLGTALLDMYSKCGSLDASQRVFEDMPQRDVVCWNSMIMALAVHGDADGALKLFQRMEAYVLRPDDITFVAVLTACSHGGLVEEGRRQFERMSRIYGIQHKTEHYTCMADALGRAGFVDEARKLLQSIPVCNTGEALAWRALLSASWHYRNIESAEFAAERLLQLEPHSGVYSLLSNIYASAGKFDESQEIKKQMKERGVQKTPGCSSIVLDGFVHEFVAGEKAHPEIEEIYIKWEEIKKELMLCGYQADVSSVTFDLEEEEKEYSVHHHSEKLVIAYAFMKLEPDVPIRVFEFVVDLGN